MYKVKICKKCHKNNTNNWIYTYGFDVQASEENRNNCITCGEKLLDTVLDVKEYETIEKISNNVAFFDAMIELKEKDPIEFQLKMSQFRNQVKQQEAVELQNIPHCPICNSTDIKKISGMSKAKSVAVWGIFSRKVHKQWHCEQCGSEF